MGVKVELKIGLIKRPFKKLPSDSYFAQLTTPSPHTEKTASLLSGKGKWRAARTGHMNIVESRGIILTTRD